MTVDFHPQSMGWFVQRTRYAYYLVFGRLVICIPFGS